jgi:3-hydroxyacyl-[acyl-carrier-protein] dehydratase
MTDYTEIIRQLPYGKAFRFVDEILSADSESITGSYFFRKDLFFYEGHFKDYPVTPGVILTEVMAQIGLVAFGIYLLGEKKDIQQLKKDKLMPVLTSAQVEFYKMVFPGQKVIVHSRKIIFRHGRLKCDVKMRDEKSAVICEGLLAGMISKV